MGKRKGPFSDENPNHDFCDFLTGIIKTIYKQLPFGYCYRTC